MDTYEFLERVNSNRIAELDIQDYVEVKTSNNLDKLKTLLSDLDNFQKNRISEIVIDSYFKNKNDSKLPHKPLDDLRQYLETKIKNQLQSQNKINSIPDVSVFSHSINNTVFDKVLLKTFEDNRANSGYYKNVFDNWSNTRINSLKNSSLMEPSKLLESFLNSFCRQLIDYTLRIAIGAHYYFKGDTKYNKYYTPGYINLFHLLNYGNDGRLNTIEIYLERLRLFREKNPFLALQFQDYCVDRIKELKNMLETNFFLKKSNPIFFHYDLIIDEFNNCINIEKERIKLELSKNNGLIENGDHSKQVLKPKKEKKPDLVDGKYSHIFRNNAFEVWQSMYDSLMVDESKRSHVKFMYEEMKKDGLIFETVNQKSFLDWISNTYQIDIQKTSNYSKTSERINAYINAKQLYKKKDT